MICPRSGRQNEFVPESAGNRPSRFEQGRQMGFSRCLEPQHGLVPVGAVGMATGQQFGLGDPNPNFILSQLDPVWWN